MAGLLVLFLTGTGLGCLAEATYVNVQTDSAADEGDISHPSLAVLCITKQGLLAETN